MEKNKKLPTITELYDDKALVAKQSALNVILNTEPSPSWVREHPLHRGLKYIPVDRVEYLLTAIFGRWEVTIKETKLIANSIVVVISLRVQDPLDSGEWIQQDGIWAMPIQVAKGSGATEFDKMASGAIQMWAPAAESYALKDAAEKLGRIFGKDLNRREASGYDKLITTTIALREQANADALREKMHSNTGFDIGSIAGLADNSIEIEVVDPDTGEILQPAN